MASLQALTVKIEKLTKQAEAIARRERSGAVQRVVELMRRLGVTVADLPGLKSGPKRTNGAARKAAGVAKYRDPATGNTWTGHGRAPAWIKGASNRDAFLIAPNGGPKRTGVPRKTAGAAKYRDPATGNTWTGHGRAPQWIKGASNRADFLIDTSTAPARQPGKRNKPSKVSKAGNGASGKSTPRKRAKAAKARKTTGSKGSTAGAATT